MNMSKYCIPKKKKLYFNLITTNSVKSFFCITKVFLNSPLLIITIVYIKKLFSFVFARVCVFVCVCVYVFVIIFVFLNLHLKNQYYYFDP